MTKNVSIIIPTYNRKNSLLSCLSGIDFQTYPTELIEVVIVDDGSTDGTWEIVQKFREGSKLKVAYYKQENQGSGPARNLAIQKASHEIIGMIDDDCVPDLDWVEKAVNYFELKPEISIIEGETYTDEENTSPLSVITKTYKAAGFMTCNLWVKKSAVLDAGGFGNDFPVFREDTVLGWKMLDKGYKSVYLPNIRVEHKVLRYSVLGFVKKHMKLKEAYYDIKLASMYPERFEKSGETVRGIFLTHTLWSWPFWLSLVFTIVCFVKLFWIGWLVSFIFFLENYTISVFLSTRMKSAIQPKHVMEYKKEFLSLWLVWWFVFAYDLVIKVVAWFKYKKVIL